MNKKEEQLIKKRFRVVIFGSARTKINDRNYKLIHTLAKMLAKEGIDIVTGGGQGVMDAASRGHHAGRKRKHTYSVGLTIKLPKSQKEAFQLDIKKEFDKFSKRLDNFMNLSNAFVIAPGGVGTTLEFFYTWQLMQVKQTCSVPIIFLGGMWKGLIDWIKKNPLKNNLLDKEDLNSIFLAKDCKDAAKIIKAAHKDFLKHGKNVCINMDKYRIDEI